MDLTEMLNHNIAHTMFVKLYLNGHFAFKVPLGNWVVGVGREKRRK